MKSARLILPSGPVKDDILHAGLATLDTLGVPWVLPKLERLGASWRPYLAGSDAARARSLADAMSTGEPMLMIRGGYGAIRTLQALTLLDGGFPSESGPLWGFSDGTALLAAWAQRGWQCWSAPPVIQFPRLDPSSRASFLSAWTGHLPDPMPLEPLTKGVATGRLVGGNLCVLTSLVGTPFSADLAGGILALEDIGESAYRVDRMLQQLYLSGALDDVRGLVVGDFSGVDDGHRRTISGVITDLARRLGIPAAAGLPFGHDGSNWSLPLGGPTTPTLSVTANKAALGSW